MKTDIQSLPQETAPYKGLRAWKAFLSSLIIFSMLWTDAATAMMNGGTGEPKENGHKGVLVKKKGGLGNGTRSNGTSSNGHSKKIVIVGEVDEESEHPQKSLLELRQEQEDQEEHWQRALEILILQKEDLDRREEELKREGKRLHEDLEEIQLLKQQLLEEKQRQEEVEHKWNEQRRREEEQRVQEEEEHQRLFKVARQKREEKALEIQEEFERQAKEREVQHQRVIEEEQLSQKTLEKLQQQQEDLAEQARLLKEERIQLNKPTSSEIERKKDSTPSLENEERLRQIALEEEQIQIRQEELEEAKIRTLESLKRAQQQQRLLDETQRQKEEEFHLWQEKARLIEDQFLKEEEERIRLLKEDQFMREQEAERAQHEFEETKEDLDLREKQLHEKERLSQSTLEKFQPQQKNWEIDQQQWAEADHNAQEKLEACRLEIDRLRKAIRLGTQKKEKRTSSSDTEETYSDQSSSRTPSSSPERDSLTQLVPVESKGSLNGHDKKLVKIKKRRSPPVNEKTALLLWQQENDFPHNGSIQRRVEEHDRSLDDYTVIRISSSEDHEDILVAKRTFWPRRRQFVFLVGEETLPGLLSFLEDLEDKYQQEDEMGSSRKRQLLLCPVDHENDRGLLDEEDMVDTSFSTRNGGYVPVKDTLRKANSDLFLERDVEKGLGGLLSSKAKLALEHLRQKLEELPPEAKKHLTQIADQDIEGRTTCGDVTAIVIGTIIGLVLTNAIWAVYDGGLIYMRDKHGWTFINDITGEAFSSFFASPTLWYITLTLLSDTISRNVSLWKRGLNFLKEQTGQKSRVVSTFFASLLPSFIEPGYLLTFELYNMTKAGVHGWDNQFAIATMILAPFLFADSLSSNYDLLWNLWGDAKEWAQTSRSYVAGCFPRSWLPSFEDPLIGEFQSKLTKVGCYFRECSDEKIHFYYNVLFKSTDIEDTLSDLEGKDLKFAKGFLATRYLLDLGETLEEAVQQVKSRFEALTEWINYGCLIFGSPFRILVLQLIGETIFGIFAPKLAAKICGWVFTALGFPFQTALEYKGIKNLFQDYLWEKEPSGHEGHQKTRWFPKGFSGFQGTVFLVPMFVIAYQVVDMWFEGIWGWGALAGAPWFLFGELATLITQYNGTYNRKVATAALKGSHKVSCCSKKGCADCKREKLIRFTNKMKGRVKDMNPQARQMLQTLLNLPEEEVQEEF